MRLFFVFLLLIIPVSGFSKKLKPVPVPFIENGTYLPSTQKETNLCIGLKLNIGTKDNLDKQICLYSSGHFSDAGIMFPLPIVWAVDVDYQVFREFPLDVFSLNKNNISIRERIYYTADGMVIVSAVPIAGQCGWDDELPRIVDIGTDATLNIDPNYFLKASFKPIPSKVPPGYTCLLTRANRDVTNNLINLVDKTINSGCTQLSSVIQTKTNFKKEANSIWNFLNSSIKLNDGHYLEFNPHSFSMSELNFNETPNVTINTTLGLTLKPNIVTHPSSSVPSTLPNLKIDECHPNFEIEYDLDSKVVDFNSSPVILDRSMFKRQFDVGRRRLTIKNVDFYYSGNNLVTKLYVVGKPKKSEERSKLSRNIIYFFEKIFYHRKGELYLVSDLKGENNQIRMSGLKFDTNSLDEINKKANWIARTDLLTYTEEAIFLDHKYQILNQQSQLFQYLNTDIAPNIKFTFRNGETAVSDFFFFHDKLISRYRLSGMPNMTIDMP